MVYGLEEKWDYRFLELAKHVSQWSKDKTKIGAVIANPVTHKILGMGYNGFPRGVHDYEARYKDPEKRPEKLALVVHAEVNAILNARTDLTGMSIYVYPTLMIPNSCPDCAKLIVQSGIKKAFFYQTDDLAQRWEDLAKYTKMLYSEAGVKWIGLQEMNS